jgi:hypothetical protein
MLVAFCALMAPGAATGFTWHEWLGLAFVPLFVLHIVLAWSWVRGTWRRVRLDTHPKARLNFLLNASAAVMMIVVIFSGLVISEAALPAMGIPTEATRRWEQLHNLTSSYLLIVVGLHLGLNWNWIAGALRRYANLPFKPKPADAGTSR